MTELTVLQIIIDTFWKMCSRNKKWLIEIIWRFVCVWHKIWISPKKDIVINYLQCFRNVCSTMPISSRSSNLLSEKTGQDQNVEVGRLSSSLQSSKVIRKDNIHDSLRGTSSRFFEILQLSTFNLKWFKRAEFSSNLSWAKNVLHKNSRISQLTYIRGLLISSTRFQISPLSRLWACPTVYIFSKVSKFVSTENHFCDTLFALLSISSLVKNNMYREIGETLFAKSKLYIMISHNYFKLNVKRFRFLSRLLAIINWKICKKKLVGRMR